jgi:hypothetical protein
LNVITSREIEERAQEFGINPADVEKDYVYGWVLHALYSQSALGKHFILKGGNGLRKAFLPNTRFSKDLDFSSEQSIDRAFLVDELKSICEFVEHQTEVHFSTDRTVVKNKDLPIGIDALEARLYFKGFYGEENITLKSPGATASASLFGQQLMCGDRTLPKDRRNPRLQAHDTSPQKKSD